MLLLYELKILIRFIECDVENVFTRDSIVRFYFQQIDIQEDKLFIFLSLSFSILSLCTDIILKFLSKRLQSEIYHSFSLFSLTFIFFFLFFFFVLFLHPIRKKTKNCYCYNETIRSKTLLERKVLKKMECFFINLERVRRTEIKLFRQKNANLLEIFEKEELSLSLSFCHKKKITNFTFLSFVRTFFTMVN